MHKIINSHENVLIALLSALVVLFTSSILYMITHDTPQTVVVSEPVATTTEYLRAEEAVLVIESADASTTIALPIKPVLFEYIEITDGCGPHFEGECLNVRSGPGTEFPVVRQLRSGIILKVGGSVERDDGVWYRIVFDEWLRYPDRVTSDWYVRSDFVDILYDEGEKLLQTSETIGSTTKSIVVDRTAQVLEAYDGEKLFMRTPISTGLEITPTPRGTFTIFKKTPSRYMQGPLPYLADQQVYDLPGVPWNLYFTEGGAVIHGAYWHDSFGSAYSHGCVNLPPDIAQTLYTWAELGTKVIVRD